MPNSLVGGCPDPVEIPAGADRETEWRLWGQDRSALVECGLKNDAKAAAIEALKGQGRG